MPTRINRKKTNSKSRKRTQGRRRMSVSRRVTQAPRSRSKRRRQSRALRGGSSGHESQIKSKKNGLKYAAMAAIGAAAVVGGLALRSAMKPRLKPPVSTDALHKLYVPLTNAPPDSTFPRPELYVPLTDQQARDLIHEVDTELHAINPCSKNCTNEILNIEKKLSLFKNNYVVNGSYQKRLWTDETNDILIKYNDAINYNYYLHKFCSSSTSSPSTSLSSMNNLENAQKIIQALETALNVVDKDTAERYILLTQDQKNRRLEATGKLNVRIPGRCIVKPNPEWYKTLLQATQNAELVTLSSCDENVAKSLIRVRLKADQFWNPSDARKKLEVERQQELDDEQMSNNIEKIKRFMQDNPNPKRAEYSDILLLENIQGDYVSNELMDKFNGLFNLESDDN